jgi:RNA recognition motif-containing protein
MVFSNATVYLGNLSMGTSKQDIYQLLHQYGVILRGKIDHGSAFYAFDNHEYATRAICGTNGCILNGSQISVSWGNESKHIACYQSQSDQVDY